MASIVVCHMWMWDSFFFGGVVGKVDQQMLNSIVCESKWHFRFHHRVNPSSEFFFFPLILLCTCVGSWYDETDSSKNGKKEKKATETVQFCYNTWQVNRSESNRIRNNTLQNIWNNKNKSQNKRIIWIETRKFAIPPEDNQQNVNISIIENAIWLQWSLRKHLKTNIGRLSCNAECIVFVGKSIS